MTEYGLFGDLKGRLVKRTKFPTIVVKKGEVVIPVVDEGGNLSFLVKDRQEEEDMDMLNIMPMLGEL